MNHRHVHTLIPGYESELTIRLLLSFTSVKSEGVIDALIEHYTRGTTVSDLCQLHGIKQQAFSVNNKLINKHYTSVQQIVGN